MLATALLILGLVLLLSGGAFLVRGASDIAESFGVSPLVVGLTVVAFGTSMPELMINVLGALNGATSLAFGNVVGSNISNLALVLGVSAAIAPITIHGDLVKREIPLLLLATTIMTVMALDGVLGGGPAVIGRSDAIILILLFCIFLYANASDFIKSQDKDAIFSEVEDYPLVASKPESKYRWPMVVGGCVMLYLGGDLTVTNAVSLAAGLGVSETVVGLFVVAVGTSLPELVTSIIAAFRKESDLALGNLVGSNLFNSLFVLPAGALIAPTLVPQGGVMDLLVSWALVAILIPVFIFGRARLSRPFAVMLVLTFLAYAILRVLVLPA